MHVLFVLGTQKVCNNVTCVCDFSNICKIYECSTKVICVWI